MGRRSIIPLLLIAVAASPAFAQQKPGAKPPPPAFRARWTNHPRIDIGALRLDFRARVAADVRKSEAPFDSDELDKTVDLARRRIGVEGQFGRFVDFQVERELGGPAFRQRWPRECAFFGRRRRARRGPRRRAPGRTRPIGEKIRLRPGRRNRAGRSKARMRASPDETRVPCTLTRTSSSPGTGLLMSRI